MTFFLFIVKILKFTLSIFFPPYVLTGLCEYRRIFLNGLWTWCGRFSLWFLIACLCCVVRGDLLRSNSDLGDRLLLLPLIWRLSVLLCHDFTVVVWMFVCSWPFISSQPVPPPKVWDSVSFQMLFLNKTLLVDWIKFVKLAS